MKKRWNNSSYSAHYRTAIHRTKPDPKRNRLRFFDAPPGGNDVQCCRYTASPIHFSVCQSDLETQPKAFSRYDSAHKTVSGLLSVVSRVGSVDKSPKRPIPIV